MNEEQKQDLEQSQTSHHHAGEDGFSRSENLSSPATPPPRGGASPPKRAWPDESPEPVWAEIVGDED